MTATSDPRYELDLAPLARYSPEFLGHKAGRSADAIKLYRRGRRIPPADVLARLAVAVGVHPGDLFRQVNDADQ